MSIVGDEHNAASIEEATAPPVDPPESQPPAEPEAPDKPGEPDEPAPAPPSPRAKAKSPLWLRLMLILGAVLIVVSGGGLALIYGLASRYESKVTREDILEGVPQPAPDPGGERGPMNFLVLGSDSREGEDTQDLNGTGARSDTIMIVHVSRGLHSAFIVSIPRDSYVDIPAGGGWRGGKNKINAALSFGGANLAAKAVYQLTQVPLDGAMIVNFNGIHQMVSAVGGVRVCTPYTVRSTFSSKVWEKGCHEMGPEEAEEFMRQRKLVPGGDLGRIKSQQNVIKGLIQKIETGGILTNPVKLDSLLTTAAQSLTVDKNLNLRDLAFALKGMDPNNIAFATAPVKGTGTTDAGSSVFLDLPGTEALFTAVREDRAAEWLAAHPQPDVASF